MENTGGFDWLRVEWQVIKDAPIAFFTSLLACSLLIFGGLYWAFHTNLELKTDMIESLNDSQDKLKQEITDLKKKPVPKEEDYKESRSTKTETISRHTFTNEMVEIDGKIFDHCRFINATLTYRGLAPPTFVESTFHGTMLLQTDHAAIKAFEGLAAYLKARPGVSTFMVGEKDTTTGNVRILFKQDIGEKQLKQSQPKTK